MHQIKELINIIDKVLTMIDMVLLVAYSVIRVIKWLVKINHKPRQSNKQVNEYSERKKMLI